jgi:hypothetical protein
MLPNPTYGWHTSMRVFDGTRADHRNHAYSLGYEAGVRLRQGERLIRPWSNRGLHVNMREDSPPACITARVGEGVLRYTPQNGDLANGRVGNGTLEYDVPLASGAFRGGMLAADNVVCRAEDKSGPAVRVKEGPQGNGTLVFGMPSSYVYLGGRLNYTAVSPTVGYVSVLISDNNGLDWKRLSMISCRKEPKAFQLDLSPHIFRRYDYQLKLVLHGAGTGLESLRVTNDIQHSQRALPALGPGTNVLSFSTGPAEGVVTLAGSADVALRGMQLVYTDFHPEAVKLAPPRLSVAGPQGALTFPVRTPGEMLRLHVGLHYRARGENDAWDVQVSFDGGRSYKTIGRAVGPTVDDSYHVDCADVPAGCREARVRFAGQSHEKAELFDFRIDAHYKEPRGGFRPVKITYQWDEEGRGREHVHVARTPEDRYTITCEAKPVMKSVILELADR